MVEPDLILWMAQTSDDNMAHNETDFEGGGEPRGESRTLTVNNLRKTFNDGAIVACENVDIEIRGDEFVVLLGPSGCGKTTILRCIAGLETPDGGTVTVGDLDITANKPKDRDLAFVFQSIALFPHMSVRENIRFGLDIKTNLSGSEKEKRVQRAAKTLGIDEYLDRKPSNLSGGQQQRVSLGRAMVMEPAAFLLDEPFSALDANLRDQMRTEIKKLQQDLQRAMIFVTHDQEEAMTLGDKIVVMNDGHIQQIGTPYEIYNEPSNRFVADFIGSPSTNLIESRIEISGDQISLTNDAFDLPLPERESKVLRDYDGRSVIMGIRPEYLKFDDEGFFEAQIDFIEPQGAHDNVFLTTNGIELRAMTSQGAIEAGQSTMVNVDSSKVWVFDKDDGSRLF